MRVLDYKPSMLFQRILYLTAEAQRTQRFFFAISLCIERLCGEPFIFTLPD